MAITFVIICVLFGKDVIAKYVETHRDSYKYELIKPIFIVEDSSYSEISNSNPVGIYKFKIKNYELSEISKINVRYKILVDSQLKNYVSIKLFRNGKEIPLKNFQTDFIQIDKNVKNEHEYQLKISLKNQIDKKISEKINEKINVEIIAEQERL